MESAAEIVRRARGEVGLTQAELASRAGTTQSAIARLESGRSNPRIGTLEQLMAAMGRRLRLGFEPRPPDVDETMLAENMRLSPADRLAAFESAYASVRELVGRTRAGRR